MLNAFHEGYSNSRRSKLQAEPEVRSAIAAYLVIRGLVYLGTLKQRQKHLLRKLVTLRDIHRLENWILAC